jgi:V8-like Glu-specific endopeptidase
MMPVRVRMFAGAIVALLYPATGLSDRFADHPDRLVLTRDLSRFSPIGIVQRVREIGEAVVTDSAPQIYPRGGRATAFYVSPCTLVTNYHVVFGADAFAEAGVDYRMRLTIGLKSDGNFKKSLILSVIKQGKMSYEGQHDWALLRDESCFGRAVGWFKLASVTATELIDGRRKVAVVSFPFDRKPNDLSVGAGEVRGVNPTNGNITFDASEAPGSSGGPVFASGTTAVIGVNVGGPKAGENFNFPFFSVDRANEFVLADDFIALPSVQKLISADLAISGDHNPLPDP